VSSARIAELVDRAFEYRGHVTVSQRDGSKRVGFVYDRGPAHVQMFDESASMRIQLALDEVTDIEFTGEDAAAKAQQIWMRRKGGFVVPAAGDDDHPVLILVALPIEMRTVSRVLRVKPRGGIARGKLGELDAVALEVGIGGGAAHAVATETPRLVISCGFAGALDPSLAPGDLVLASTVSDDSGDSIAVPERLRRAARLALARTGRLIEGDLLTTTEVAATVDEKCALFQPGRRAVDLESWPAARAAQQAGVPWLALRVVVDPLGADLPQFARDPHANYLVPALRHALGGPSAIVQLAQLGLRARRARRSLENVLVQLGTVIGGWSAAELGR
jgi:adenosylhomocysteine nucleosidase